MMPNIDYLTLVSGVDVPLPEYRLTVRQPKIREIAMIGEKEFYRQCGFLLIDKEKVINTLSQNNDRESVEALYGSYSEYELLTILIQADPKMLISITQIFDLLFPDYEINMEELGLMFAGKAGVSIVYAEDYENLRDIIKEILCLNSSVSSDDYNPADEQAKAIAEKLRKRRERLKEIKDEGEKYILGNYLSSLAIGTNSYSMEEALDLTIYQLFDQIKRYGKWNESEVNLKAILAGAKDVEQINWFETIK